MERTRLRLHPGEEIRTPRILLLSWQGDRTQGHNLWRRLLLAHYTPRPNGQLLLPPVCDSVWGERAVELQIDKIQWLVDNEIPVECFWIDAGWYGDRAYDPKAGTHDLGWAQQVGNLYPNPNVYPDGLGPVGRELDKTGLGFLLWVEPERAFEGTQMAKEHPEWLLGPAWCEPFGGNVHMLNLGIPEAREAMTEWMLHLFRESGVTHYRQDFNFRTVPQHWSGTEAPDRVGMTEIRYIEGLYQFMDALLEGIPGLVIDNCAGGGQRLDLEMMMRSVPLWRSDRQCWPFDPIVMQTQTQGLAPWIPLSGSAFLQATQYAARSALGPGFVTQWSTQAVEAGIDLDVDEIREMMSEMLAMRKYFSGDYYSLVSYSLDQDSWAAWQYDLSEQGQGMVVAFRRRESPFPRMEARLRGLDPALTYRVTSRDTEHAFTASGRALMTKGFAIEIDQKPGSALFEYSKSP
jgi:alpha-galactosidase